MFGLLNRRLNVVGFAPSFSFILAVCMDSINLTRPVCFGYLVLKKSNGPKLARALRSKPIIIPTVFPNIDTAPVCTVINVFSVPPMLRVLTRELIAIFAAPSAEHCVGQLVFESLCCCYSYCQE